MSESLQLTALQTNSEWARSSVRAPPVGCAVASVPRGGSNTPYTTATATINKRDFVIFPHGSGLAAIHPGPDMKLLRLPLPQLPPDAQVISLDVAPISLSDGAAPSPVLALTFFVLATPPTPSTATSSSTSVSASEKEAPPRCSIHFYGSKTAAESITGLIDEAQALQLDWMPTQIAHLTVWGSSKEHCSTGFLVTGCDLRCHLFVYNYAARAFTDVPLASALPELLDARFHAPSLCVATAQTSTHRLIAVGFQNGRVLLTMAPLEAPPSGQPATSKLFRTDLDGPITALHLAGKALVRHVRPPPVPAALQAILTDSNEEDDSEVLLLVGGGIGYGVLYRCATQVGFDRPILLPDSHLCDGVLATRAAPLLREGERDNLLLGTYGHELSLYVPSSSMLNADCTLAGRIALEAPIYGLACTTLDNGLPALTVQTSAATHVLAPSRAALRAVLQDATYAFKNRLSTAPSSPSPP